MKRDTSRTPSPQQRSRPKLQRNSMVDAVPGSQHEESDVRLSVEDVFTKLKPLNGTSPRALTASISDDENGRVYCIQGNSTSKSSKLWCLHISTMEWENIPIHAVVTDIFFLEKLPCRYFPGLALFGPKDHRRLLLFGGRDAAKKDTSELFYVDLTTKNFSSISVGGGSIAARRQPSMFIVDDYRLFIVGGLSADMWLKTFSLAVFDPLTHLWSWHEQDRQLSSALEESKNVIAVPVYDGKKVLLLGTSRSKDKVFYRLSQNHYIISLTRVDEIKMCLTNENIFTFDPKTYIAVQDSHAQPGAPSLPFSARNLCPGPAANEVSLFISRDTENFELWSYRAFPENEWGFLLEFTQGPDFKVHNCQYVIICMGKTYILIADKRDGKKGVNAYIQVDDVVEVNTHSSN